MSQFLNHLATKIRKKLRLGHALSELDPQLVDRPLHFRAPQLDADLLAAIKRISPQFHLRSDEAARRFWELNQNGACWGEYLAAEPFLTRLGPPKRVLDIGPGLGRSAIFFKQLDGWQPATFDLYEGSGESTKYTQAGPRFEDSFCGDIPALTRLLEFNEIEGAQIFDAADLDYKLSGLPGPYDLIYSFFAVGFHWSIEHFLDEILGLMGEQSIGIFTLHDRFKDLSVVAGLPHRVVVADQSWPRDRSSRLLILSKSEELLAD